MQKKDSSGRHAFSRPSLINELWLAALKLACADVIFPLAEEEEEGSDSGSEVDVKKPGRRHKLLRKKLTLSEGESDNEKPAKSNKEVKRRGRRKGQ